MAGRFNQFQPNAPAYAGGPAMRSVRGPAPTAPVAPVPLSSGSVRPPGAAAVPGVPAMMPMEGALGPSVENSIMQAMNEIMGGGDITRKKVVDAIEKQGGTPTKDDIDQIMEVVKTQSSGSVRPPSGEPTGQPYSNPDQFALGPNTINPVRPPGAAPAQQGALAPSVLPAPPVDTGGNGGGALAPVPPVAMNPDYPLMTGNAPPLQAQIDEQWAIPSLDPFNSAPFQRAAYEGQARPQEGAGAPQPVPALAGVDPASPAAIATPATLMPAGGPPGAGGVSVEPSAGGGVMPSATNPAQPAPANSLSSQGGILQALLQQGTADAATAKALDKQDMGLSLLMAGLRTLGHTPKLGEGGLAGIAAGAQTGINTALSMKATRVGRADKAFDKRLKVAGLYTDLTVAQAKLEASAADKQATLEERKRSNRALESIKGDMTEVRKAANQLTDEKNRTTINRAGADSMEEVEKMVADDLTGQLDRNSLVQTLVIDAHPGSAIAGKLQRTNYARAVAAIDANPGLTAKQKTERKAEAKKGINGWLTDWNHKGI